MRTVKSILIIFLPMALIYLFNILIFNKYPMLLGSFCGSALYIPSLDKMKSFKKLTNNFIHKEETKLSNEDLINLVLVFILTLLFIWLIYVLGKHDELGTPFWGTSVIFLIMGYFKIPKRFYS